MSRQSRPVPPTCALHTFMLQYTHDMSAGKHIAGAHTLKAPLNSRRASRPRSTTRRSFALTTSPPTPNAAEARAIASDFIVTGNDMRTALADYAR